MAAIGTRQRHPLRVAGLVAVVLVLVAALAALVLFLWLRAYAPLSAPGNLGFAPGPGLGADVEPVTGSGGKTVFIPAYRKGRPFDTAFTIRNTGRFAVTVTGLGERGARPRELEPGKLLASDSSTASADPANVHAFHDLDHCAHGDGACEERRVCLLGTFFDRLTDAHFTVATEQRQSRHVTQVRVECVFVLRPKRVGPLLRSGLGRWGTFLAHGWSFRRPKP